ncbi:hypothetical protein [Caudoviricetes sp.]|nr:hypothetical protein [Caudoviricetes sp.]
MLKQIALTAVLMLLAASLTANYFLLKQITHIEPITLAELK